MERFNNNINAYAKQAVLRVDPTMSNMPKLLNTTQHALAMHFKDNAIKEINCPGTSQIPASPLDQPTPLNPYTPLLPAMMNNAVNVGMRLSPFSSMCTGQPGASYGGGGYFPPFCAQVANQSA